MRVNVPLLGLVPLGSCLIPLSCERHRKEASLSFLPDSICRQLDIGLPPSRIIRNKFLLCTAATQSMVFCYTAIQKYYDIRPPLMALGNVKTNASN